MKQCIQCQRTLYDFYFASKPNGPPNRAICSACRAGDALERKTREVRNLRDSATRDAQAIAQSMAAEKARQHTVDRLFVERAEGMARAAQN